MFAALAEMLSQSPEDDQLPALRRSNLSVGKPGPVTCDLGGPVLEVASPTVLEPVVFMAVPEETTNVHRHFRFSEYDGNLPPVAGGQSVAADEIGDFGDGVLAIGETCGPVLTDRRRWMRERSARC